MDAISVSRANTAYGRSIYDALNTLLYDVAVPAVSMTLRETVMQTWQDSSNAAFNWYVISKDSPAPSYKDYRGQSPVGSEGDKRSLMDKTTDKEFTALTVLKRELPKIKETYKRRAPTELSFYNAVESSPDHPYYALNAEIYKPLNDPEVTVTFAKVSALSFEKWKKEYGF